MNDLDIPIEQNPMIFLCTLSSGRISFDVQVVSCEIALSHGGKDGDPDPASVVQAMRKHARPIDPEKGPNSVDDAPAAELLMAFARATQRVEQAGKTGGERPSSTPPTAASPATSQRTPGSA